MTDAKCTCNDNVDPFQMDKLKGMACTDVLTDSLGPMAMLSEGNSSRNTSSAGLDRDFVPKKETCASTRLLFRKSQQPCVSHLISCALQWLQ